ncbi:MDR family MFS transporter [Pseudonocardia acaciae]|uniref:MDR family MFS transporter n=1 Tax=Pseudonocardia acaciae TaxID=551276 RepID=UPI0007E8D59E|nr:MDR family MFS transporter [Pseudonocardia acaciae]
MTTTAPTIPAQQPLLTQRQILTIIGGLMAGMFLAALDQTIVATAIRTIADDLSGLSLQAWVTTAYLITSTLTTPLYGKLSDLYGRKPLFLFAIAVFVVGSVACTFSGSMYQLAAFRALQGIGAGGLFSLALTIIGDIVSPRERAKYQGYFVAVFATASVLGPLAGGLLAGQASILGITGWRWVFLVNVPIGIVALFVVTKVLNLPHAKRHRRVDWPGAIALAIGLVPLLLVAEQGRAWGWGSTSSVVCFAIAAIGLALFIANEWRYGEDALLPLRFFRNRTFGLGTAACLIVGMGMFGGVSSLPLYLQIVKGATPTEAGLLTLPLMLGIMSMSTFSGQVISRTGTLRRWPVLGVSLMITGLFLLSRVGVDTSFWWTGTFMLIFGWGLGSCMQTLTLSVQNAMPAKDMGVATASATFFRQMGGTMGTAVFLSILFSSLPDKIGSAFRAVAPTPAFQAALVDPAVRANPANEPVLSAVSGGGLGGFSLEDSSFLGRIDGRLALPFLEGFSSSMSLTLLVGAVLLIAALALVIFLPDVPLRQESGIEAQRSAAAAATVAAAKADVKVDGKSDEAPLPAAAVAINEVDEGLRDKLLANLVTDLDGTLATLKVAERARDDARRVRRELNEHTKTLFDARRDLARQGLTTDQVNELLDLSPAESSRKA